MEIISIRGPKADRNLDKSDHNPAWGLRILYDGDCPLCAREIRQLRRLDARGRLAFEDIAGPGFAPAVYGLDRETVMARIHGMLPGGEVIEGMELFRRAYAAVGLGWLLAPTRWPGLRRLADAGYAWFARNRLRMTGRGDCAAGSCEAAPRLGHQGVSRSREGVRPASQPREGVASREGVAYEDGVAP